MEYLYALPLPNADNVIIIWSFPSYGYSEPDRTGTSTGLPTPSCLRPPPTPMMYILLFPPDCDYMLVYVSTFGGRARKLSSSLAS